MEPKGIDFAAIPQTAVKVVTSPAAFFRTMPKAGGFVEPLVFAVVMGVISGLIQALLGILGLRLVAGIAAAIASVIFVPIVVVIGSFVGAAIMFVIWKLMGSQESYETAFRCGAYLSALTIIISVLGIIPYAGAILGIALMTFFLVVASVEVHKIPSNKAWLVFGIIGAVLALLSLSGQFAARRLADQSIKMQKEMEETSRSIQKQTEEMQKKADEAKKAAEEMQKKMEQQTDEMKKAVEEMHKQQSK